LKRTSFSLQGSVKEKRVGNCFSAYTFYLHVGTKNSKSIPICQYTFTPFGRSWQRSDLHFWHFSEEWWQLLRPCAIK